MAEYPAEHLRKHASVLETAHFIAKPFLPRDLVQRVNGITSYAQLLAQRYDGELDEDATMFVANIVNGVRRMHELVSDLLVYSQVGSCPDIAATSVDLNSVLETVTENLKTSIEETQAVITSDRLPVLSAHASDFIQLFQNLIANSLKYRSERTPCVHISVQRQSGELRFAVTDNGMGIDAAYHKQIFQPFKRLHDNKIPGTGLGLATYARIVERYDGRISVESRTGEGATFLLTLHETSVTPACE